jgi:hypothetical protein
MAPRFGSARAVLGCRQTHLFRNQNAARLGPGSIERSTRLYWFDGLTCIPARPFSKGEVDGPQGPPDGIVDPVSALPFGYGIEGRYLITY